MASNRTLLLSVISTAAVLPHTKVGQIAFHYKLQKRAEIVEVEELEIFMGRRDVRTTNDPLCLTHGPVIRRSPIAISELRRRPATSGLSELAR